MNRSVLLFVCFFILNTSGSLFAQEKENISPLLYKASAIPDSLKSDANSVVRYSSKNVVVKAPGKATLKYHYIVTALNKKAEDEAVFYLNYDKKYNSIVDAEFKIYSSEGVLIKRYRKSDMYDGSATDGFSIVTDDRFKAVKHNIASFPVTIETTFEMDLNNMIDFPDWVIQDPEQSVQTASYTILASSSFGLRYQAKNIALDPLKKSENNLDSYKWEVKNLKAIKLEYDAAPWKVLPRIRVAGNSFEFYGLAGDLSSWKAFGEWQQQLLREASDLSAQREAQIRLMTADFKTDKEKVKFLYEYLQKNMRYISIQLGMGGLKPFPASYVDEKKYGDCKALANYMIALLKAVNIPAYYSLIRAGENEEPADTKFVNDPFNHVIVCIPFKNDTTWLECTSKTQPFGKLGTFTENRNALLITEEGGKLVNTPKSIKEDNKFDSNEIITVSPDGGATAQLAIKATGEYRSMLLSISSEKVDDQKNIFIRSLNLKQPDVLNIKYGEDSEGKMEVTLELKYNKLSEITSGDKSFYRPRVLDIWNITIPVTDKRNSDFYFDSPMQKSDIMIFNIPAGYEAETMPANVNLNFSHGSYSATYTSEANAVKCVTKFEVSNQVIPASGYADMQKFMDDIVKAQSKKLIIRKKI